jgi:hypothetical protein
MGGQRLDLAHDAVGACCLRVWYHFKSIMSWGKRDKSLTYTIIFIFSINSKE